MSYHPLSRGLGAALALGVMLVSPVLGGALPAHVDTRHFCPGAIDVPVHLTLTVPDGAIAPGATVQLQGTITADADLANAGITISSEGSVRLLGPPSLAIGSIQQGMTRTFQVPAQFLIPRPLSDGRAAVTVSLNAQDAGSGMAYKKEDGVYAITRGGQFRAAEGAYITAEMGAIREDLRAGLITDEQAETQSRSAVQISGAWNQGPSPVYNSPSVGEPDRSILGSVQPMSTKPIQPRIGPNKLTSGNVTFDGNVSWTDRFGGTHPAFGTSVTIWQFNVLFPIPIPTSIVATDVNGDYHTTVFVVPLNFCFVEISTSNTWVQITPVFPLPIPYLTSTAPVFDPAGGSTIVNNFLAANSGTGPSLGLHSMVTYEAAFTQSRNGGSALGFFPVQWPGSSGSAFYDGIHINLRPLDRFAYDVMYHEWGHYVMDSFNFENNPGGPHNIGDCIAQVHSSKDQGLRLAWGEGWPTYWGTTAQHAFGIPGMGIPTAGDDVYTDTEAGNFSYSLENDSGSGEDSFGRGEDNEIAVQRILWDLVDTNQDNRDLVNGFSDQTLVDILKGTNDETLSQAWGHIRATLTDAQQLSFGAITTDALVGPGCSGPANNAVVSPSANKTFSWTANVGCPSSYAGNAFSLRFFTPGGTPVLTLGGIGTTSRTISNGELNTLVAAGHNLKWAVEGSHTGSPATGPYLGENRNIVIDNPPVADAGPDQLNVECTSFTTTPVHLNGLGSSDPDGDPLTYTWSAPGVVFNNNHSATPIGQFPDGTTIVTLTVSDGILSDTDQMTVRVVDTTPPVIACPNNITVECNSHCGTHGGVPATDPAIVAFLAGASATDICDPSPTVGPDSYPACFEDGFTVIHFTATDDHLNSSHCQATVHVVDTTPPTISVSLDRNVLWPPNHKLVTINATVTVTDLCDPDPTFQLISITSNEPDNGLGDGDTQNDIQGTSYGTADTQFQLRSERSGGGAGRKYTITYRAFDHTGNHTDAVVVVRVPHDQSGAALAADGLNADGTGFATGAQTFAVVIQSLSQTVVGADEGDLHFGGPGSTTPGGTDLLFSARAVDEMQAYVGNGAGVLAPSATYRLDANGDGLQDLVCFYKVADAVALAAASAPEDGPVGLHYNTRTGTEYLVNSIFGLGTPIVLPDLGTETVGGTWHGGHRGSGNIGAESQGQPVVDGGQQEAASPAVTTPAPKVEAAPSRTELAGVYPNPVHSDASVVFSLSQDGAADLSVYDVRGARVRTLQSGAFPAGRYTVRWDGRDDSGRRLGGGMYFVRLSAGRYAKTLKTAIMP